MNAYTVQIERQAGLSSIECEQYVIGAVIAQDNGLDITDLVARLTPDHFTGSVLTRQAWQIIRDLHAKGHEIDAYTVANALKARGTIKDWLELAELGKRAFGNLSVVISVLEQTFVRRRLVALAERIMAEAPAGEVGQLAIEARSELDAVIDAGRVDSSSAAELAQAISTKLDQGEQVTRTCPTGFRLADWMFNGGFRGGELVVLGARPSIGKTAMGVNGFAVNCAEHGIPVHVVTLEMSPVELATRIVSSFASVAVGKILGNQVDQEGMVKIVRGIASLAGLPLTISSPRDKRLSNLIRVVRSAVRREKARIVVIDYLQLIRHDDSRMPRFEAVAEISGTMKSLAMELNVPIVVLAQLNRSVGSDEPRMAHLRESGAIEQDADIVLLIHRPDGDDGKPQQIGYLKVEKNRNGETGRVNVEFLGFRCAFCQTEREPDMPARRRA